MFEARHTTVSIPYVWVYAATSRSAPAFEAEYGEEGSSGLRSVNEPSAIEPYTSSVEICT